MCSCEHCFKHLLKVWHYKGKAAALHLLLVQGFQWTYKLFVQEQASTISGPHRLQVDRHVRSSAIIANGALLFSMWTCHKYSLSLHSREGGVLKMLISWSAKMKTAHKHVFVV